MMRRQIPLLAATCLAMAQWVLPASPDPPSGFGEPLFDWSPWEQYRTTVKHPGVTIKAADIARAKENIKRYVWAKNYAAAVEKNAQRDLGRITPEFLAAMIPETTPGDPLWTPCPSCREQGKPVHPHGLWSWSVNDPEHLKCTVCGTVFPNDKYPEDTVLRAKWRKPQEIRFYGGDTFVLFGYKHGRPSFTANIRARKVRWIAAYCRTLAEAFVLTGKLEYARACRDVLLRFAACYPNWLVHVGYGEYADMDPRIASLHISNLPEPELCFPPNKPDRKLHTGFWTAGRAGGVGMESAFVRNVVEAYDLTCEAREADGSPLYTDAQRRTIERDLLLESTILMVCDKQINNKSVSNRTATALVGMCVGHPGLVRFGLEGFYRTVDGWFLPDGTTSESPVYGLMTLGGIWDLAEAFLGYSDPLGYHDPNGNRIDKLNLYRNTAYERVWEGFFRGLQGDLTFPPYADCSPGARLPANFIELMVANYPDRPEYLALLRETFSGSPIKQRTPRGDVARQELLKEMPGSDIAIYVREPGLEEKTAAPLVLPDWCPPDLRIGHMRTGKDGRESLLLLSASHWGNHHHLDSLNLYYWKNGHEVLSDLGYLWDHPKSHMTRRTVAHHTVVLDEKDQLTVNRGGEILFFKTSPQVKAMEAQSSAYAEAKLYRRTSAVIDHGEGRNYVVDFFRVEGGKTQDYVYHASAKTCDIADLKLAADGNAKLYDLANVRVGDGAGIWRATWQCGPGLTCTAWNVGQQGERAFVADGWGQRDWKNSDIGATIPYVVRRCEGTGLKTFISVFDAHAAGTPLVRSVNLLDPAGVVVVETIMGRDYVMCHAEQGTLEVPLPTGMHRTEAHFAVVSVQGDKIAWTVTEPMPASSSP